MAKTWLVWVLALGRNSHRSKTTAVSSCTKSHHAENLQCNQRPQARYDKDCSAPVNKDDLKDMFLRFDDMFIIQYCKMIISGAMICLLLSFKSFENWYWKYLKQMHEGEA